MIVFALFIRADERTHLRKAQHSINCMTNLGAKELELRTRELFTECLVTLGAAKTTLWDLVIEVANGAQENRQ